MEFTEAIEIIKNIVPESSANEYDGIIVKRLEASNTLDEGRTTNQTHIAISGEQMNMFPYLMADGYFKCDYNDRDEQLKKYFITQIPLYIYKDNVMYLADGEESGISFGDEKSRCVRASIVRSRRKEQADQVQLSLTTIDDPAFVSFRRLLHTGDYLVILKHKEKLVYDCIGIKAKDETRGEYNISALNNKFYKLPTNTKVDIKELIEIKNTEIENKKFTVDELGSILKEMYGNAEDKMQVASIHIFGIKYGRNIIENEFKAPDIIKAAGLNGYLIRAAMLAFYKDPEKWVTGSYIKIGYFGKSDSDLVYQDEMHGPLIEQVDKTVDLVYTKYMKALIDYEGVQRIEQFMFHKDAFREILLNAIVHKDYSSCNPIQISVYDDKIYIWNDGEMPPNLDSTDKLFMKHSSKPYNPKLANIFFKSGMIEAWGRGFEKIREACALYDGPLPELWFFARLVIGIWGC